MTHLPVSPYWAPSPRPERPRGSVAAIVAAVFIGVWVVAVAVTTQFIGWFWEQYTLAAGLSWPRWTWPIVAIIAGAACALPSLALWLISAYRPVRELGRAWTFAAVAGAAGGLIRAVPPAQNESYLILLVLCFGALALATRRRRVRPPVEGSGTGALAMAVVAGLLVLVPFLWLGALGGTLEIVLGLLAAAMTGVLAASLLDSRYWAEYATAKRARLVLLGGLGASVALTLIASGTGASGAQLIALFVLPPLGFVAACLGVAAPFARRVRPVGFLVGVAALGPLALIDPDEITVFLLGRDAPFWALVAGVAGWLIAVVLALVYPWLTTKIRVAYELDDTATDLRTPMYHHETVTWRVLPRAVPAGLAIATLLGSGVVYAAAGQPGAFGEQLFVVMKSRASLADIPATTGPGPGREARIAAVYHRLVDQANQTQADLRHELDRLHIAYQPYYLVNGIRVAGGPGVRALLERRGDVARVLQDPVLRPLPAPITVEHGDVAGPTAAQWNLTMVGAPQAWARGARGAGITVGSSDSGVDGTHPDLRDGYRGGDDSWFDPWSDTTEPNDHNGHGTHTMGTAVGRNNIGVAPDAQWIGCVNLERNLGSTSHYLDCLQFMLAPFPRGGNPFTDGRPARAPEILTNSWGCPDTEGCDADTLRPAIDAFTAAGIAFVAAAGNTGPYCDSITDPPAPYPSSITVAAVNRNSVVADFSSRGDTGSGKPDLAAPGVDVLSAMPGDTYAINSGTSMATPHVAGVIALLWSAKPALIGDIPATMELLRRSAQPATPDAAKAACASEDAQAGAGIVNAAQAIAMAG